VSLSARIKGMFRRDRLDRDLNEELRSHVEMRAADNISSGMPPAEARYDAQRRFGNTTLMKEDTRAMDIIGWLDTASRDVRYAVRMLRRSPGFTAVAVLTLALGISANTALFSVVNGVLLNPLPYPHSQQLVTLHESKPNFQNGSISYPNFRDWQKDNHTFSAIAISRGTGFSLTGLGEAEQLSARAITSDYFSLLGVKPVIGRTFRSGEDEIGAAPLAMISQGLWNRKFSASPEVLGKSVTLDGRSFTIVGVFPTNFELFGRSARTVDVYVPIGQWRNPLLPNRGAGLGLHGIGRLKPGVTNAEARADMDQISSNLAAVYPDTNKGISAHLTPFRDEMLGDVRPVLFVLLGAVGFVLLIACTNVANLLLARSTGRAREFAIRGALGAGQGRLVRQLLTESILLGVAGGGIGLLVAQWATRAMLRVLPTELPRAAEIRIDAHVLIFTMAVSVLAGILFGLAPALKISQPRLQETLKEGGRGSTGAQHHTQGIFVITQMALALVLLIGAGLMMRSLSVIWSVNPGFRPDNVLTFSISLPPSMMTATPGAIRARYREIENRFASTPGVQAIAFSWGAVPIGAEDDQLFWLDNQPKPSSENDMNWTLSYVVGPGYLKAMGVPLERGRFLTPRDNEQSPHVAVIDTVFAHKYFGDENPIGRHINFQDSAQTEIVGVVGHIKQWGLDKDDTRELRAEAFLPFMQLPDQAMRLAAYNADVFVRSDGSVPQLFDALRQTNRQMSGEQVVYGAQTMNEIISGSLAARRFSAILLGVFAALALLLASVGIYGVLSYLVGQRTNEIGIRMALGAGRTDVLRLVMGHGLKMTFLGVVIGLAASIGLTRLMANMLYRVSPTDPLTFAGVALVLALVALAACYIPARRAMRVDPIVALRYE
jgi:predicted permease